MIMGPVLLALDRLADLVIDTFERAGTEDVLLVPARVRVEDFLFVDEVERVGERRQKRAGRKFEAEDNSLKVGRLDFVDHQVIARPCAQLVIGGGKNLFLARSPLRGSQKRAGVEIYINGGI